MKINLKMQKITVTTSMQHVFSVWQNSSRVGKVWTAVGTTMSWPFMKGTSRNVSANRSASWSCAHQWQHGTKDYTLCAKMSMSKLDVSSSKEYVSNQNKCFSVFHVILYTCDDYCMYRKYSKQKYGDMLVSINSYMKKIRKRRHLLRNVPLTLIKMALCAPWCRMA